VPVTPTPRPPYHGLDWDDDLHLEETPEALRIVAEGLFVVDRSLQAYAPARDLTLTMFTGIHRGIFGGLFPHFAGFLRGPEPPGLYRNVTFGPYRGTHAADVRRECDALFATITGIIRQLDNWLHTRGRAAFAEQVLQAAAYVHCELIRIHPFVNGNGRATRKCVDYFCWRYGLLPPIFAQKVAGRADPEYKDAVRTHLQGHGPRHFADYLRPLWDYSGDMPSWDVPEPS